MLSGGMGTTVRAHTLVASNPIIEVGRRAQSRGGSRTHCTATPLLLARSAMPEQVVLFFKARQVPCPLLTSRDWLLSETFGHAHKAPHPPPEQRAWKLCLARIVLNLRYDDLAGNVRTLLLFQSALSQLVP